MSSETSRIEAFSDGVFAIAITLLILDVKVPSGPAGHLGAAAGPAVGNLCRVSAQFLLDRGHVGEPSPAV
jgi:uncharacterized membrane protein